MRRDSIIVPYRVKFLDCQGLIIFWISPILLNTLSSVFFSHPANVEVNTKYFKISCPFKVKGPVLVYYTNYPFFSKFHDFNRNSYDHVA